MENKEFVTCEQAIKLRELGFKERCYQFYDCAGTLCDNFKYFHGEDAIITSDDFCISHNSSQKEDIWDAPTLSQVQTWLRKEKRYSVEELYDCDDKWSYFIGRMSDGEYIKHISDFNSPEEALSAGISETIKILTNDN